jgi:hypothetical protein
MGKGKKDKEGLKGSICPRGGVNWAFLKFIARIKSY